MFQSHTFLASHTNTKSPTTTKTAGRMQAEKHRSALPKAPIQASGALAGHGIAQHHPRLGGHWRRGQQWLCPPVCLLVHLKARAPVRAPRVRLL